MKNVCVCVCTDMQGREVWMVFVQITTTIRVKMVVKFTGISHISVTKLCTVLNRSNADMNLLSTAVKFQKACNIVKGC